MKRVVLSIFVSALLQDAFCWISQPEAFFARRSSLQFQSPMAPMDFIDVEVTGHAKGSPSDDDMSKRSNNKALTEEERSRTKEILMPSISPTMSKGKIVEWLVRTGDTIRTGDPIMVIESEKEVQGARGYRMNQDVNANVDGVLAAIYQQPGQAVEVGAVLGIIVPDFIIDAEIEVPRTTEFNEPKEGTAPCLEENKKEELDEPSAASATTADATADAQAEDAPPSSVESAKDEPSSVHHAKVAPPPTLMDEMMPSTAKIDSVGISSSGGASAATTTTTTATAATISSGSTADWVHGHHASTDGMVNDNSFYSTHKTQTATAASPSSFSGGNRSVDTSFRGSVDSTDPFYSPYFEGVPGPGTRPRPPPPPPPHPNAPPQHPSTMKPDGAGDNFYEAYQENQPSPNDPYVQQMQEWQQQSSVGNANMGDYYQAERNGQLHSPPVEQNVVIQNPTSSLNSPPPPRLQNNGYYSGQHIGGPSSAEEPPQEVFVKGVSPQPDRSTTTVAKPPYYSNNGFAAQQEHRIAVESFSTMDDGGSTTLPATPEEQPEQTTIHVASTAAASTGEVPPPAPESPVAAAPATAVAPAATTQEDLEQFRAMESRIVSLEESLRANGQDSIAASDKVKTDLENLKRGLENLKKDYDEKVLILEQSYRQSLSQAGRDFDKSMEELRDWDTLTVNWDIRDFEKTLDDDLTTYTSEEFNVAGYSMTLEMQIFGPNNDEGSRDVGFYIMHTGGLNYVPIMIGGSKIIIESTNGNDDENAVKVFVDDASIEDSLYGWGWKKFFDLQDLKQSFVNDKGEIQVSATVRVKRVRTCRINTAI